jgi:SNF2 family DNA or RNA helicase
MPLRLHREANLAAKHQGFIYQVAAVEAVKDLEYAAIFHEQGLGKTKIGVDLCLTWLRSNELDSILIVTKKGLIQNWVDELRSHCHLIPQILTQDRKKNFFAFNSPSRLYLTYYEVIKGESKRLTLFQKTRRVGVILDEAHKIKNPDSSITQVLYHLSPGFSRRVIMTGTPVANRPFDLWAQIYFLDGGDSLGTDYLEFKKSLDLSNSLAFDEKKAKAFEARLSSVYNRIQSFSVRETKESAGIQLPNKVFQNLAVEMEPRQAEIYNSFRREFSALIIKNNKPVLDDAEEVLKRLLRLVQVASNPRLVDTKYQRTPGKYSALEQVLDDIINRNEKTIIWTSFTENVEWLARQLTMLGTVRVHGKMSYEERNKSITAFKTREETRVLVATPGAAKEGLTLTVANHAIFYDRTFSLDDYLQAQDRIHRISQTKICFVTNLIAIDTIDEWVDVLLSAKQLAAKLGQGDITKEQYEAEASYTYGEMVRDVLSAGKESDEKG